MSTSVLGSVTLGYQLIWDQWRKRCGVRLLVDSARDSAVDGLHLLAAISEIWPSVGAGLILCVQSPALLVNLLEHAPSHGIWLEIRNDWLADPLMAGRVRKAAQRGLPLVWQGEPGQTPAADMAPLFHKIQQTLTPMEALAALRVALRQTHGAGAPGGPLLHSPVIAGGICEGLASQALVEHALDHQHAWGVAGWPAEEILYGYRYRQIQISRPILMTLVHAIDADEPLENLERRMGDEPLLTYRFLRHVNAASLNLRNEIGSVRQGLMTVGLARFRAWLMTQQAHASSDPNLDPIRAAMILRARTMEWLSDAGADDDLRREVFLCGLFSQVDLLLGESLGTAIHRLPLPGRVASAILGQTGPYAPLLEVASALESGSTRVIRDVCEAHDMPADEVNRALLRALAAQP